MSTRQNMGGFTEPSNFIALINQQIERKLAEKNLGVSIWQVTDIKSRGADEYITEYRCNIKHLNFKFTLDDVPIVGIGLGHTKGVLKYPNVGDFVLVAYTDSFPVVIGTVYDFFTQSPDSVPQIKLDELIIVNKEKGSIILMKADNSIVIKAESTGAISIEQSSGRGIFFDTAGNLTVKAKTINFVQIP